MFPEFQEFRKIPRLSRDITITEKIDGTNGLIYIDYSGEIFAGSRSRWLWGSIQDKICNDNHGFARFVKDNQKELMKLGPGYHYGEWYGKGVQKRHYNLSEKRFALFNTARWIGNPYLPSCCQVVPILYTGLFDSLMIKVALECLQYSGSHISPGYMDPEGIVIYHCASRSYYKKTISNDEKSKNANE